MVNVYISHRGNLKGADPKHENKPSYVEEALRYFDCEVDLRFNSIENRFYLGHDLEQYSVNMEWLIKNKDKIWVHCKDFDTLNYLSNTNSELNYFWHENDEYTITSHGFIWTFPGKSVGQKSVIVDLNFSINAGYEQSAFGICSDNLKS